MKLLTTKYLLCIVLVFISFSNFPCIYANDLHTPCSDFLKPQTIAIIGGGMAGVSAATFLGNSDFNIHLFESNKGLGGHAQTAFVENGQSTEVDVDLGPQYFAKGPWNLYIELLKYFDLYKKKDMFTFEGSLTTSTPEQTPYFVTPGWNLHKLLFNCHLSKLKLLYTFYKFNKKAHVLFKTKVKDKYFITVDEWLTKEKFSRKDQETLLLPFLGSLSGVNNNQARELSILALTKLFAFSHPLQKKQFTIPRYGMGNIINKIGSKLEQTAPNIHIHRGTVVTSISRMSHKYHVKYRENDESNENEIIVDKIISAVHPHQLIPLLSDDDLIIPHLHQLKYVENHIVLHNSTRFNRGLLSSVVDIESNHTAKPFMTMKLGKIHPHFGSVYKSWINDEQVYNQLKETNSILAESTFKHPFVTPNFVFHRNCIQQLLRENEHYKNMGIAGGWTELTETQATAILSAYKAVTKICPEVMEEKKWEDTLPSLKNLNT